MSYIDNLQTPAFLQEQPGDEELPFAFIIRKQYSDRMKALNNKVPPEAVADGSPYEKHLADSFLNVLTQAQMLFNEAMEEIVSKFEKEFGGKNND